MTLKWVVGCGDGIETVTGYRTGALMRSLSFPKGGAISAETKCIETQRLGSTSCGGIGGELGGFEISFREAPKQEGPHISGSLRNGRFYKLVAIVGSSLLLFGS